MLRCSLQAAIVLLLSTGPAGDARADDADVPIALQVQLLARLLWYERNLQKDPDPSIAVLIVERPDQPESARSAGQLEAQLSHAAQLGGKRVELSRVSYESTEQIAEVAAQRKVYAIYLSTGLRDAAAGLARQLEGRSVLTVSADGDDVAQGVVLGFELASSKPRITLSLTRAHAQKLDFSAQLLRVVRVLP